MIFVVVVVLGHPTKAVCVLSGNNASHFHLYDASHLSERSNAVLGSSLLASSSTKLLKPKRTSYMYIPTVAQSSSCLFISL